MAIRATALVFILLFYFSLPLSAAPMVNIPFGRLVLDSSQHALDFEKNNDAFQNVKLLNVSLSYGLTDSLAVSMGSAHYNDFIRTVPHENPVFTDLEYAYINKIKATEFKLQHKLNDHLASYIGMKYFSGAAEAWLVDKNTGYKVNTDATKSTEEDKFQVGFIYNKHFNKRTNGFATFGLGDGLKEFEIGIDYKITRNTAIDLSYKFLQVDLGGDYDAEIEGKGFGFGVNVNF